MKSAALGIFAAAAVVATASAEPAGAKLAAADAEQLIRAELHSYLKDPESAQLRLTRGPVLTRVDAGEGAYSGWLVCADVNAKNSYGGYIGFERYLFVIDPASAKVAILPRITRDDRYFDTYRAACVLEPAQVEPVAARG